MAAIAWGCGNGSRQWATRRYHVYDVELQWFSSPVTCRVRMRRTGGLAEDTSGPVTHRPAVESGMGQRAADDQYEQHSVVVMPPAVPTRLDDRLPHDDLPPCHPNPQPDPATRSDGRGGIGPELLRGSPEHTHSVDHPRRPTDGDALLSRRLCGPPGEAQSWGGPALSS